MNAKVPKILLVLPLAFQDGIDKHVGIMRFLNEKGIKWDIRIDRLSKSIDNLEPYRLSEFDGFIVDDLPSSRLERAFSQLRKPLVVLDWRDVASLRKRRNCVRIESDSKEIGTLAAQTLQTVDQYASFAYLPVVGSADWSDIRGSAFAQALARHGKTVRTLDPAAPIIHQVRQLAKPAALFAANDVAAAGFLDRAKAAGIPVPQDVSVLGVDNERLTCLHTDPPLASIQPDFEQAGYLAATALQSMLCRQSVRPRQKYRTKGVVSRTSMEVSGTAGRLVQRVHELIRNTPVSEFGNITTLAEQLGISRRLLDMVFRQVDGRTVLEAIQERRLNEVCHLLEHSSLSILDICETCFPGSGTYPMRLFKKKFGLTMRAYREKRRAKREEASAREGTSSKVDFHTIKNKL